MREVVSQFHDAGVKVLLSYNPWDSGTRPAADPKPDWIRVVELIKAVGADGANGDTMNGMSVDWWNEAEKLDYPVMLQPELGFGELDWLHNITYNTMSWAYLPYAGPTTDDVAWTGVADLPIPSKYSYLVSGHHAQICERWARQHTNGLQHAFFMGRGFVPWENVWGVFNAFNEGDGEALRRTRPLLTYTSSLNLTIGADWTPFAPETALDSDDDAVAVSRFLPASSGSASERTDALWLMVNRRARDAGEDADIVQFTVDVDTSSENSCFYDLYLGKNITDTVTHAGSGASFNITIDPMDFGAVLQTGCGSAETTVPGLEDFLHKQAEIVNGRALSSYSFKSLPQPQQQRVADSVRKHQAKGTHVKLAHGPLPACSRTHCSDCRCRL